ncbi:hypothetical protein [Nonlabens xiamenensis]|uniref:hypothetical protein n=1 Tax=Nonlabens xiamenensis TaxID=2341043 RepID=UPI000F607B08|nr:hypothetical protein [Nonlabens xiamenensis]
MSSSKKFKTQRVVQNCINVYANATEIMIRTQCSISAALRFLSVHDKAMNMFTLKQQRDMYYAGKEFYSLIEVKKLATITAMSEMLRNEVKDLTKQDIKNIGQERMAI